MRASEPHPPKSSEAPRREDFDPDDRKVDDRSSRVGATDDDDVETDDEELAEQDLADDVELGDGPDA
jgi:hypothetical protein